MSVCSPLLCHRAFLKYQKHKYMYPSFERWSKSQRHEQQRDQLCAIDLETRRLTDCAYGLASLVYTHADSKRQFQLLHDKAAFAEERAQVERTPDTSSGRRRSTPRALTVTNA